MELEQEYDDIGGVSMLHKLREFDPISAEKLDANDKKRIVRAFEVFITTGITISQHDLDTKAIKPRYEAKKYALTFSNRDHLYTRIDNRVDSMLEKGLYSEVSNLLEIGIPHDCTAMQAIGYKEIAEVVLGKCDISTACARIKMSSRRYAKRQLTWLRRDMQCKWIFLEDFPDVENCVRDIILMR